MKKWHHFKHYGLLSLLFVFLMTGCGIFARTPEELAQTEKLVRQRLDSRDYKIDVAFMIPMRGGSESVSGSYSLEVKDKMVDSYLPYVGVATSLPYGGGKGLNFKDKIKKYRDSGWKKDQRVIVISTDNGEDDIEYTITVFTSGDANIYVHMNNKDDISYTGSLDTSEKEKE